MNENDAIYRRVGERIRFYRLTKGLSQQDLADKINLTRASLSNVEVGRQRTPLHVIANAAGVLGVALADLVVGEGGAFDRTREAALLKLTDEERIALGIFVEDAR